MSIVAGIDFGTLSVRCSLMDTLSGKIMATATESYPLKRSADEPLRATQSHTDQMQAMSLAFATALSSGDVNGKDIAGIAADTTGSSVIFVDQAMQPISDYYLWCDHRAHLEAAELTQAAKEQGIEALNWCGGVYSHEWGYAKVLHFLRHNPDKRQAMASAVENCDMVVATLCGVASPSQLKRSVCAMGHKWMWGEQWGGYPGNHFLASVDPLLTGINQKLEAQLQTSDVVAGTLCQQWADKLGIVSGVPIATGAFDAHWDALGCGATRGDVVNVVGTSTCIVAIGNSHSKPIKGICGMVPGSVHPDYMGIEAGLSATGDIFDAIARRCHTSLAEMTKSLAGRGPGSSGLLRLSWDNGDRTILTDPDLGAVLLGLDLNHSAADELHAAIEGTAFHTRIILEQMQATGATDNRIINAGGIPGKNPHLNQIYADVLQREIWVPDTPPVGVGACLFAGLASGAYKTLEEAQESLCPSMTVVKPNPASKAVYDQLYQYYRDLYFNLGAGDACSLGDVLPALRKLRIG